MAREFACGCAITMKDIAAVASKQLGWRISLRVVNHVQRKAAQEYCDEHFDDTEEGCINNPYLPRKMIGQSYVFTRTQAKKILCRVQKSACRGRARGGLIREAAKRMAVV